MNKIYIPIFLFVLAISSLNAQNKFQSKEVTGIEANKIFYGAEHVWLKQENIIPSFIQFREEKTLSEVDFLFHIKKQFQLAANYSFQLIGEEKDEIGYTHKRFQLEVDHVPVKNGIFILHLRAGKVIKYNGYLFNHISSSATPRLTENIALRAALTELGASIYKWEIPEEEAFIKREQKDPSATFYPKGSLVFVQKNDDINSDEFILCWKFDVYAAQPMGRSYVYVDANTGNIVSKENRICDLDRAGTAITVYRGSRPFTTDSTSATNYRLRELTRGLGINTYNMRRGTNYGAAVDFTDSNNVWNNINANEDQYAADGHWGAEKTYDFYASMGRNSIDNAGYPLNLYLHYSTSYLNAFWDGTRMTFGDGDASTTPLVSLDITGHEISHGLDERTANLTYSYESGALNESFSDIFGAAVEFFGDSATANWTLGEDIGMIFRSMSNPNTYTDPDTYLGTYWATGSADAGGVHTNSGVQNYWYYLLSMGGSGTNDIGSVFSVTAQGRTKATAIAWRNLTYYLTAGSNYADARYYAIQSAQDLYGYCSPEVIATTNAWYAVGVGPIYSAFVDAQFTNSSSVSCAVPYTVNFTNASVNAGTFTWDFGDGSTSTATSPSHTYTSLGTYTVKLIASSVCGIDSISYPGLVNLSASNPCVVTLPSSGSASVQTSCTGTAYDNGGQFGLYTDDVNSNVTISPSGASTVTLTYTKFRMENAYDYVYIYDGPSTASPLIRSSTGTSLPTSITSSGPSITIRQSTDPSVVDSGFAINWSCNVLTPVASFRGIDSNTCTGIVAFTDLSTRFPTSWRWSFGDGDTSLLQNPTHTYLANGTYTVSLVATNSAGSNTRTKASYIVVNKPTAPIASNGSRCGTGIVSIGVSATPGTINWYTSSTGGSSIGTGNPFSTPSISSTTTYYAEVTNAGCISLRSPVVASIKNANTGSFAVTICNGASYIFNGINRTSTGIYLDTLINAAGCDSVLTLNLTVRSASSGSFAVTICNGRSYSFNGINRTTTGSYLDTLINSLGCDSIVTLNLTVRTASTGSFAASICSGASYNFNGINRTTSGSYLDTLINSLGCDSVVTLHLSVTSSVSGSYSQSICFGTSYLFNGIIRSATGAYFDTLVSSLGCDSIITFNLTVRSALSGTISRSLCPGASYVFNGVSLSSAGTYLDTLTSSAGCDSIITLHLSILSMCSASNDSICVPFNFASTGVFVETALWNLGVENPDCDTLIGNSSSATTEPGEPLGSAAGSGGIQKTMWYFMKAPTCAATSVRFSTNTMPTSFNTRLSAYHRIVPSSCSGPFTELASNDDAGIAPYSTASSIILTPGSGLAGSSTYNPGNNIYVQVSGYDGDAGDFGIIVDADAPDLSIGTVSSSAITVNFSSSIRSYGTLNNIYLRYRKSGDSPSRYFQITLAGSATSRTITGLLSGETYEIWAMYRCATEDRWVSRKVSVTTTAGCSIPLSGPTVDTSSVGCSAVNVRWTPSSIATRYVLYWRRVGFTSYGSRSIYAPITSATITGLLTGTSYQFWVTTICTGGATVTSPITVYSTCGALAKLSNHPLSETEDGVYRYQDIEFHHMPLTAISNCISSMDIYGSNIQLNDLNAAEESVVDRAINFDNPTLSLLPNPAQSEVTIHYQLPSESVLMSIKIYNIEGKEIIKELMIQPDVEGSFMIDLSDFSGGIYFVKVEADNYLQTRKLIVHKD